MKKTYVYAGTWPILLRGSIPGVSKPEGLDENTPTGIFCYIRNEADGSLTPVNHFYTDKMTSELCAGADGRFLYANDEGRDRNGVKNAGGSITALSIDPQTGRLTELNDAASFGMNTTCVETDPFGRFVFAANLGNPHEAYTCVIKQEDGTFALRQAYERGTIAMYERRPDGALGALTDVIGCETGAPGEESHYHCIRTDPAGRFLLACDTNDRIQIFGIDADEKQLVPLQTIPVEAGSVPRTIRFHPNGKWFFVNHQDNSMISVFSFNKDNGEAALLDYTSAVFNPEDSRRTWSSQMAVSPDGAHLYVTSRSLQMRMPDVPCPPDTIAVFLIDQKSGQLTLLDVMPAAGSNPRGAAIDPSGKYLYVTSMDTGEIYCYTRDEGTGLLSGARSVAALPFPSSLLFLSAE